VLLRTGAEAWGAPQRFERGSGLIDADAVVRLPDGGVAVAYERRSPNERPGPTAFARPARMVVRRAPVGGAFGAPETIARIPPHWTADEAVLRVNSSGGLLLSWQEGTHGGIVSDICEGSCHQRVVAAFAPPGQPFGPARIVSRLGTALPDVGSSFVAALSDAGRGLVAWQTGPADANSPQRPMAATGDQTADRPIRADRNRPRFSVVLTRRALRSAARGARLRARIRCNERCAVRVLFSSNFGDEDDEIGLSDLRVVVLERVGSRAATWRLSLGQRRVAQRLLKNPRAVLVAIAIDAAGNTAVADKPLE
jgi:hypothetical protein